MDTHSTWYVPVSRADGFSLELDPFPLGAAGLLAHTADPCASNFRLLLRVRISI